MWYKVVYWFNVAQQIYGMCLMTLKMCGHLRLNFSKALDSRWWEPGFESLQRSINETSDWDGPAGGSSRGQINSIESAVSPFDKHVKFWFQKSPNEPEFHNRTVVVRVCALLIVIGSYVVNQFIHSFELRSRKLTQDVRTDLLTKSGNISLSSLYVCSTTYWRSIARKFPEVVTIQRLVVSCNYSERIAIMSRSIKASIWRMQASPVLMMASVMCHILRVLRVTSVR